MSRLDDAGNAALSLESRFDLAYNAAHALALLALRRKGYRADQRYVVFQTLPHLLGVSVGTWRLLARCHVLRNHAEYEGMLDVDEILVRALVDAARTVLAALDRPTARGGES